MIKLMNKKELNTRIDALKVNADNVQNELHEVALQTMLHHFKHSDTTLANRLIEAMPKAIRKADLYRWFIQFGAFEYDIKNKVLIHSKEKFEALDSDEQIELANATPFYLLNNDKEVIKHTFLDELKNLEKKIVYDIEKRKNSNKYTVDDLSDVRKMIKAREEKLTVITSQAA